MASAGTTERRSSVGPAQTGTADGKRPGKTGSARSGLRLGRSPAMAAARFSLTIHTNCASGAANTAGQGGPRRLRIGGRAGKRRAYASSAAIRPFPRRGTAVDTGSEPSCGTTRFLTASILSSGNYWKLRSSGATTQASCSCRESMRALTIAFRPVAAEAARTSITASGATSRSTLSRTISPKRSSWRGAGRSSLASASEGPVPHDADAAERARLHLPARLVRVRPALIRHPHPYRIPAMTVKRWPAVQGTPFLPAVNDGASWRFIW